MAAREAARLQRERHFSLYWVSTNDADEDCFVVASTTRGAARFFADAEGYEVDDVDVERVVGLPRELQTGAGWKENASAKPVRAAGYGRDDLLQACGIQIAVQRTSDGTAAKDYVFEGRHFRGGDVVTHAARDVGQPEPARLAAFDGGRASEPEWWELELTPHVEKRMEDRDFTEVDLRAMIEAATGYRKDVVEDRFVVETRFRRRPWEIIVEPDATGPFLVVVTAYGVDR